MILQKLCRLYDRLDSDPEANIAKRGYAPQKVVFKLILEEDGTVFDIIDMREESNERMTPKNMLLPQGTKRTSGIEPMPFWDKSEYILGWSVKDELNEKNLKRFQAWKNRHLDDLIAINKSELNFLKAFLESWEPDKITEEFKLKLKDYGNGFGIISLRGERKLLHEYESVASYLASKNQDEDIVGQCLLTGESNIPLEQLHPNVKGFKSQQNIVAFNKGKNAFESYGNKDAQAINAPVSKIAAFK